MAKPADTKTVDTSAWAQMGRNIKTHREGDLLFIAVNVGKTAYQNVAPTPKGNVVIATTQGNQKLDFNGLAMGVNIYGPPLG